MKIKSGVKRILGKTISGIIVKDREGIPKTQLFLLFDDDTWYEFYSMSEDIKTTSGDVPGGLKDLYNYMGDTSRIVFEAYKE